MQVRRFVGSALIGLGVLIVGLAVAVPLYVVPRLVAVPSDPDREFVARGTGITLIAPGLIVRGEDGRLTDQDVTVTRVVTGEAPPDGSRVPAGQAFYRLAFAARVDDPGLAADDSLLFAWVEGASFDRRTGLATRCCGDYVEAGEGLPGTGARHTGLVFRFPVDTQRTDYPFWDAYVAQAPPARFDGVEKIRGLETYRFRQSVGPRKVLTQAVPGYLFDRRDDSVDADRIYSTVRTLWVEPRTGAIIDAQEQVDVRLEYRGAAVPAFQGPVRFDDATVAGTVAEWGGRARALALLSDRTVLVAGVAGVLLLLAGVVVLRRGRRRPDPAATGSRARTADRAPRRAPGEGAPARSGARARTRSEVRAAERTRTRRPAAPAPPPGPVEDPTRIRTEALAAEAERRAQAHARRRSGG